MRLVDRLLQRWRFKLTRPWASAGAKVLDIGCHQGEFLKSLGGRIGASVGMDPLAAAVACPTYRLLSESFQPPAPFDDASFDMIVLMATLEHIRDKPALRNECSRLLCPGGRVVVTVPSLRVDAIVAMLRRLKLADGMSLEEHHGFDPRLTPSLFTSCGFEFEYSRRFQLGLNHLFVFRKKAPLGLPGENGKDQMDVAADTAGEERNEKPINSKVLADHLSVFGAALGVMSSGCGKPVKPINSTDAICLAALAPYHETHKADENGRVIDVKLEGRQVDDLALDQVKNLSELRVLSLFGSSVTDAGVAKLSGLKYLDSLGLGKTPVTDHGLVYLEKMPCLHYLWLNENPQITDQAVENLKKKALPGLTVYR